MTCQMELRNNEKQVTTYYTPQPHVTKLRLAM